MRTVVNPAAFVIGYSGGAVLDFHQLPNSKRNRFRIGEGGGSCQEGAELKGEGGGRKGEGNEPEALASG